MTIKITGSLAYIRRRREWSYRTDSAVVHCDYDGCGATMVPSGLEHNGPWVESIYQPSDMVGRWYVGTRDLCPTHAPTLDGPCPESESGVHDMDRDVAESEERCWTCGLWREIGGPR